MAHPSSGQRRLVLASQSPRRKGLLSQAGFTFDVMPSTIQEPDDALSHVPPEAQAEALAYFKARQVSQRVGPPALVLGSDTLVALDARVFNKARDADEAKSFLQALSGSRHRVITGLALIDLVTGQREITHVTTQIVMRPMSAAQIDAYVASGAWRDKAGAYSIQEGGDAFVEHVIGSWTNVVGLPVERVVALLAAHGVVPHGESAAAPAATPALSGFADAGLT